MSFCKVVLGLHINKVVINDNTGVMSTQLGHHCLHPQPTCWPDSTNWAGTKVGDKCPQRGRAGTLGTGLELLVDGIICLVYNVS